MAHPDARREEVLALLKANGGNVKRTARESGIPFATVALWKQKAQVLGTESCSQKQASLEELLENIIRVAAGLLPGKLEDAKASETGTVLGICFDKLRLLRQEPTSIQETRGELTEDERLRRLAELLDAGESRAGVGAPDPGGAGRGEQAPAGAPPIH